ncbi:hypothetical protein [Streptomyces sp. NPDC000351]|uniref:hypothetical protein n=1 Tax=Streptomyces sp. NPDC000351 TaxID=3154250 RepID=UPI003323D1B0
MAETTTTQAEVGDVVDGRNGQRGESRRPVRVRLPAFIDDEIGLGEVVRKVTYGAGLRPCSGCEQRAATLNRWVVFTGRAKPR